jgi:hypothetical protein
LLCGIQGPVIVCTVPKGIFSAAPIASMMLKGKDCAIGLNWLGNPYEKSEFCSSYLFLWMQLSTKEESTGQPQIGLVILASVGLALIAIGVLIEGR